MNQEKRAWIYCRIDAPEDTHGALKGQWRQLMDYAGQMGVTVVGSSEDMADDRSANRAGLNRFMEAADAGSVGILLIRDLSRIGRDACQSMALLEQLRQKNVAVFSPLEGRLSFSFQRMVQDVITHSGQEHQEGSNHGAEKGD